MREDYITLHPYIPKKRENMTKTVVIRVNDAATRSK